MSREACRARSLEIVLCNPIVDRETFWSLGELQRDLGCVKSVAGPSGSISAPSHQAFEVRGPWDESCEVGGESPFRGWA